ncbi:hypothetical protein Tco_0105168, partial [Tanacetum coccineum]
GRTHNIHKRSASPFHLAKEDHRLGNLKFVPKGENYEVFGMQIPNEMITNNIRNASYYNTYLEMLAKHDQKTTAKESGKKKSATKANKSKKPATAKQLKLNPVKEKSSKPAPAPKPKVTQEKPAKPSPAKHPKMGKVQKIHKGKSSLQLIDEDEPTQPEPEPEPEHQGEGEKYDVERAIQMSLKSFQAQGQAHVGGVAIRELVAEATRPLPVVEGKGKEIATEEQATQSLRIPATKEASTRPSAQPQDDASANIVYDSLSPTDAETGADTDKTNSGGDTEILQIGEELGKDVTNVVDQEEKTDEINKGQAGSDPGKTLESRPPPERVLMEEDRDGPDPGLSHVALAGPDPEPMHDDFVATVYPQVHESLKHPNEEHVHEENPLSSTGTLSSIKNLDAFHFGDQFFNDKPTKEDPGKTNMETEVKSMVTIPIYQASSSVPPLSTPAIDLSPPKPVPSTTQAPIFTGTTATTTITLPLPPPLQQQSTIDSEELPDADMKEILHQRMFESGTYKSLPEHVALYEALEASIEQENKDEFLTEKDKSCKRRPTQPPAPQSSAWETSYTREAPSSSSKQKSAPHSKQPVEDMPIPDTMNISNLEDTNTTHLPKIKTRPDCSYQYPDEYKLLRQTGDMSSFINWFCKRIGKKKLSKADLEGPAFKVIIQSQFFFNKDLEYLVSGSKERRSSLSISKLKAANYQYFGLKELVPSLRIESEREYDISAAYGISHWWFKRKEFYITRHSAPSDRSTVRSHMWILSVVTLKTYERYGYTFLKEIVLHRADYNEYKISEADFKNLHLNDFEDAYLLHLQGQLNHLSSADKVHLFNAVNLWIRNIIIRKRVEDLQLGIESYQTKLNLTQPDWDASEFLFKKDYIIVSKLRTLEQMVKDIMLFKYNPGMETRIWYKDDRRMSKEFMELIERRLKIRRIFMSLGSFVGGILRDVDYKLIQRTE